MDGRWFPGSNGCMITTATLGAAVLLGAIMTTAMVAGLVFSFAHSVVPGLGKLDDRGFLTAFYRIDVATSNPWMMSTFLGSPALTLAALLLHLPGRSSVVPWAAVALVLVVATVVITVTIHLPVNTAVRNAAPEFLDTATLRSRFEIRWVRWNVVRAVTSTGTIFALCGALYFSGRAAS